MKLKVNQTMTAYPISVKWSESLTNAYRKMQREGVRHLPVVDDAQKLVGIISDRDFRKAMWPLTVVDAHGLAEGPVFKVDAQVSDCMSWPVKTLPKDCEVIKAVEMMLKEKISAVVISDGDQIQGIITTEDLLMVLSVLLQSPEPTLASKALSFAYNSPLGKVADMLANAGI